MIWLFLGWVLLPREQKAENASNEEAVLIIGIRLTAQSMMILLDHIIDHDTYSVLAAYRTNLGQCVARCRDGFRPLSPTKIIESYRKYPYIHMNGRQYPLLGLKGLEEMHVRWKNEIR